MFASAGGLPDPSTRGTSFLAPAANPVDVQVGPDGALYADFDGHDPAHRVLHEPATGGGTPAAATPTSGPGPASGGVQRHYIERPRGGQPITYAWDLDGDGGFDDSTASQPSFTYTAAGTYTARLRVTDPQGASTISSPITITANNTPPTATIPGTGGPDDVGRRRP